MDSLLVRGDTEHGVGKLNGGNLLAVHIDDIKLCHCVFLLYAFTLSWMVTTEPFGPGDRTLDRDQIVLSIDFNDAQVLDGHADRTHVAGQTLALEHAGRAGSGTVRTGMTCNRAGAVALTQAVLAILMMLSGFIQRTGK